MGYILRMPNVTTTDEFASWLAALRDDRAKARIAARVQRLAFGNPGDAKSVGGGIVEMRIDYGPGYRVYYMERGKALIVILCGGDKATQKRDIERARAIAAELE